MFKKFMTVLSVFFLVSACSGMAVKEFKNAKPELVLEEYFTGRTEAWGLFEDRFGKLRRQFKVTIDGTWDGETLTLDERFKYEDGETDQRIWRIKKIGRGNYEGRAADVIGIATGVAAGNALNWRYEMDLKVGDGSLRVAFNDWMFLQTDGILINRARVSKLGVEIGSVTLFFKK